MVTRVSVLTADPARLGLIVDGREHTYRDLQDRTRRAMPQLADFAGSEVAVVAEPRLDVVVALFALWELGATVRLIHPKLPAAERAALAARSPSALPADWEADPGAHPSSSSREPATCAVVVHTSGSTGRPKGVRLSHANLIASARASEANLGWRDDDRWLCPLPLAHVGGLSVIARCVLASRCAVLGPIDALEPARATLASVVPTQLARLADRPAPPALRALLLGGAPAAPELLARAAHLPVLRTYGMSETASQIWTEPTGVLPGVDLHVGDDGRLRVRGPMVMLGYDDGTGVDAAGWYDTGDLAELGPAGELRILGRADDLIITGGENVHPAEVEAALRALPGVRDACVVGVPDPTWGEVVAAAIVGTRPADLAPFAPHHRPRRILELPALPLTATGKVDRTAIRALLTRAE